MPHEQESLFVAGMVRIVEDAGKRVCKHGGGLLVDPHDSSVLWGYGLHTCTDSYGSP